MENRLEKVVSGGSWFKLSRFGGAMRYHWLRNKQVVLLVALIVLIVGLLELAFGALGWADCRVLALAADFPFALAVAFFCAFPAAKYETTFLLRFGTPRTSVWLSNVISLVLTGAGYLIASVVVNAVIGCAGLALSGPFAGVVAPDGLATMGDYLLKGIVQVGGQLPMQLLWLLEYSAIFYLLACCMRRWKVATIAVIVGVPALLFTLLLLPAFNEVANALESGAESQLMVMIIKLLAWLDKAGEFIADNWQWIQGGTAFVCLVLSFFVMRGTRQPE